MDFAALPPEVNSSRMYAGPGSGPLLAAAAAWSGLAAELRSTATAYESAVSALVDRSWLGPSSAAMAAATGPYVAWLGTTAVQAEQTAAQAKAAVAAYETAFAMTVPPPVIAANRAQLLALVATNLFGQNTAAIAATEAHYGQMWAQDAAAMYGYAGSATAAAELTPFGAPPRTANSAAATSQGAGVAQAAGQAASSQLISASLTAPAQGIIPADLAAVIPVVSLAVAASAASVNPSIAGSAWNAAATNNRLLLANEAAILTNTEGILFAQNELQEILGDLRGVLNISAAGAAGPGVGPMPVSAALGQAVSAGKLSVPLNWATAAPGIRTAAYALPATGAGAAPAAVAVAPGTAFSQMALAGMGGSAMAGSLGRGHRERFDARPAERRTAIPGEPVESPPQSPEGPMSKIVTVIRGLGELRDLGFLTADEFNDQKQRLLRRQLPG